MANHRKPPKPKHYDKPCNGYCRMCGKEILREDGKLNKRRTWHPECIEAYQIIYWPAETRKAVWSRDRGRCAGCGDQCTRWNWELDHRQPLIEAQGRIEYWMMPNLQTLCSPCHAKKTGAEATARAAKRRAEKEKAKTAVAAKPKPKKPRKRKPPKS